MMGAKIWCVAVAFVAPSAVPASTEMAADLRVSVVSSRVGLLFTDAETPDVRASVEGAPGPTLITWQVRETEGPWQSEGRAAVPVKQIFYSCAPVFVVSPLFSTRDLCETQKCGAIFVAERRDVS